MRIDDLHNALANPGEVDSTFLKEWEELAEKYPYFNAVHVLLAKASHSAGHLDYESRLQKAALYTGDRKMLYDIIIGRDLRKKISAIEQSISEEADEVETIEPEAQTEPPKEASESQAQEEKILSEDTPSKESEKLSEEDPELMALEEGILHEAVYSSIEKEVSPELEDKKTEIEKEGDETKGRDEAQVRENDDEKELSPFAKWLQQRARQLDYDHHVEEVEFSGLGNTSSPEKSNTEEIEKKSEPSDLIEAFIKKDPTITPRKTDFYSSENLGKMSLVEDEDFVTETLAKVYIKQGKIAKAKKVYKKLSLKYPEKSVYFANQLKKLQDKT